MNGKLIFGLVLGALLLFCGIAAAGTVGTIEKEPVPVDQPVQKYLQAPTTFVAKSAAVKGGELSAEKVLGTGYNVYYHTSPIYGSAPLLVRFSGNLAGDYKSFEWAFGDGFHHYEQDCFHTYTKPGTYTATLTAVNATGYKETSTMTVTIEPPGVVPLPEEEEIL